MRDFLSEGFLIEYAPGRLVAGWGPFESHAQRLAGRLALFAPDFFLTDPAPWKHPARWAELSRDELAARLPPDPPSAPRIQWVEPDRDEYLKVFRTIVSQIDEGELTKAVPVVIERGDTTDRLGSLVHWLVTRVLETPATKYIYGAWDQKAGLLGASPEVLFRALNGRKIETAAIAGTYPSERAEQLIEDPKELAEHQSVVDDIREVLSPFGEVDVKPLELLSLPGMVHLKTDMEIVVDRPIDLATLAGLLHPTAAVGVLPRTAGLGVLHAQEKQGARERFGAPFGIEWPDGRNHCLVAIRNVQWRGSRLAIAAGGGVIAQSRADAEWNEVRLKCEAVKRMLSL